MRRPQEPANASGEIAVWQINRQHPYPSYKWKNVFVTRANFA